MSELDPAGPSGIARATSRRCPPLPEAHCRVVDDLVVELTELARHQTTLLQTLATRAGASITSGLKL